MSSCCMRLAVYDMSQSVLDTMADATMAVLAWLGLNTEYWPPVLGVALFVWVLSALWSLYRNLGGVDASGTSSDWDMSDTSDSASSSDCGDSGGGGCDCGGGDD